MIQVDDDYTITIVRGDSGYVNVPLIEVTIDEHGERTETEYQPQTGDSLRFAASKKYGATEEECFIIRDIPLDTKRLYFNPEDTKDQKFGEYKYDLELTRSNDNFTYVDTILKGKFVISEEVY